MNQTFLFLSLTFLPFCHTLAQDESEGNFKHQIGIQVNPFLNEMFFQELEMGSFTRALWVFSGRYGYNTGWHPNLLVGGEVQYFQTFTKNPHGYSTFNAGPWARYNLLEHNWLRIFAESSVFISYYDIQIYSLTGPQIKNSGFDWGYYVSPGVSLNAAERRWSFDFSWKFSTIPLIDNRKNVFSLKVNYRF
ncbi:MAG: hypothetical protein EA393_15680 [Bacteroidetes bacterium]|nr:MAG: hypothetical protein EA393_15680 [Bacteroidota bacterium]